MSEGTASAADVADDYFAKLRKAIGAALRARDDIAQTLGDDSPESRAVLERIEGLHTAVNEWRAATGRQSCDLPEQQSGARAVDLPVELITVGVRQRNDLGDIDELAASIEDLGLLHPVVVDQDNRLVAGGRRLAAVKSLGWKRIPARIIETEEANAN